jgi:hypothetical protein
MDDDMRNISKQAAEPAHPETPAAPKSGSNSAAEEVSEDSVDPHSAAIDAIVQSVSHNKPIAVEEGGEDTASGK